MRSTPRDGNVIQFPEEAMDPLAAEVADIIAHYGYAEVLAEVQLHRPVEQPKPRTRGWRP
jgi:hypothetical protein